TSIATSTTGMTGHQRRSRRGRLIGKLGRGVPVGVVKTRGDSRGPTTGRQAAAGLSLSRGVDFASSTTPDSSILVELPLRPSSRRPLPGGFIASCADRKANDDGRV